MTNTANLEDGFYWVRKPDSDWLIAERWSKAGRVVWFVTADDNLYTTGLFDEIDPRPIKREDVKTKSWMDNITDLDSMGAGFSGG